MCTLWIYWIKRLGAISSWLKYLKIKVVYWISCTVVIYSYCSVSNCNGTLTLWRFCLDTQAIKYKQAVCLQPEPDVDALFPVAF